MCVKHFGMANIKKKKLNNFENSIHQLVLTVVNKGDKYLTQSSFNFRKSYSRRLNRAIKRTQLQSQLKCRLLAK